jgi:hypothetical protein
MQDLRQHAGVTGREEISADVRFGSKADIRAAKSHVHFAPESGHVRCTGLRLLWANSGHRRTLFYQLVRSPD